MTKSLGFMILCIPLYVWGSEGFSVSIGLYETPRYAMSTSNYDSPRYSPIFTYKSPSAVDYLLEGVGGAVGGTVGGIAGGFVGLYGAAAVADHFHSMGGDGWYSGVAFVVGGLMIGGSAGVFLGTPAGVSITGKLLGYKGSYRKSLLGTALGMVGGIGLFVLSAGVSAGVDVPDQIFIGIAIASVTLLPVIGAVWGYNRGKKDE